MAGIVGVGADDAAGGEERRGEERLRAHGRFACVRAAAMKRDAVGCACEWAAARWCRQLGWRREVVFGLQSTYVWNAVTVRR